jgi:hypothetical protein
MDQQTTFYREQRKIADVNANFMDLVREGMTREELARNIERRPSLWKRFEGCTRSERPPLSIFRRKIAS